MDNDTVYVITEFTKVLLFLQRTTVRVRCFKFFTPGLGKCMFPMAGKANNNRKGCLGSSSPLSDSHPYTVGLSYTWQPVFLGTLSVDRRESQMGTVHKSAVLVMQTAEPEKRGTSFKFIIARIRFSQTSAIDPSHFLFCLQRLELPSHTVTIFLRFHRNIYSAMHVNLTDFDFGERGLELDRGLFREEEFKRAVIESYSCSSETFQHLINCSHSSVHSCQ